MIRFSGVCLMLGGRMVLDEISFQVKVGETMVILGGSGTGKTTILRLILGLYRPDCGSIWVAGQDISRLPEKQLSAVRQNMAMVFQSAALFDSLTVHENVGYRLSEHGTYPEERIEQIVRESLQFVGLADTMDKMPGELSGGMRKRVGIARALASGAQLLLFDEPTAGLDPINTSLIIRLILRLKHKGVTQVVVTHDLETAYAVADRIIMLHQGRVVFEGTRTELQQCNHPAVRAFLHPGRTVPEEELVPTPISGPEALPPLGG